MFGSSRVNISIEPLALNFYVWGYLTYRLYYLYTQVYFTLYTSKNYAKVENNLLT